MRHQSHDYSLPGAYFVTFVTKDRKAILAAIKDGVAIPTSHGQTLKQCWSELPQFFPGLLLDAFQIMPDHAHAILILTAELRDGAFVNPKYTLSKVMSALKSNSARRMNQMDRSAGRAIWQDGFMDRVIRSENELNKYRSYILNNPLKEFLDLP